MRVLRKANLLIVFLSLGCMGQQFYRSQGLNLFNRGQYHAAIDSIKNWAEIHSAERGIANYYVGECYYNLGMDGSSVSEAVVDFQNGMNRFNQAMMQTDLRSLYTEKMDESLYKKAWCSFRIAELVDDPSSHLTAAFNDFLRVSETGSDSLQAEALYMTGESQFRLAVRKILEMHLSSGVNRSAELAREALQKLDEAEKLFLQVTVHPMVSRHLSVSARIRHEDVLFMRGKLYQTMSSEVFASIRDTNKKDSPAETARFFMDRINYKTLLGDTHRMTGEQFRPMTIYSSAVVSLNLIQIADNDQYRQQLNFNLDSLTWSQYASEKLFIQGNRDHLSPINSDAFVQLTDLNVSYYAKAARELPEAWYWLGWTQFVANIDESENQFNRFLNETKEKTNDPRLVLLREEAEYRKLLLRFDRNASNKRILSDLKSEIDSFQPENQYIREQKNLLLQLVRVGLDEPIWGQILRSATTSDRLDDAFILIRNMLVRASRVTGKDRVPYLKYLDNLFEITQDRRNDATIFYRGLSLFLKAEIQETAGNKLMFYVSAADNLKLPEGPYEFEGMYVRARSYFAAAKHEKNRSQRNKVFQRARPLFIRLINDAKSLRSAYYLGEIFRIQENDLSAKKCYEVVMEKTRNMKEGAFWYNNAKAGLQSCGDAGNVSDLDGISIDAIVFPDNLLIEKGEAISLERLADPDYVRKQYWDQAIDLMMKFGLPKKELYPSVYRLASSRYAARSFRTVTAGIRERIGSIESGLLLKLYFPAGLEPSATVTLDGITIEPNAQGQYRKAPIQMNQLVEIKAENSYCYPYINRYRFIQPGIEQINAFLTRKNRFVFSGTGIDPGLNIVQFSERVDKNTVLRSKGYRLDHTTFLYKDFESDITNRDYCYSDLNNGYLVVNSGMKNPMLYRNDQMVSKEGEFNLLLPDTEDEIKSAEGVVVDSRGNIYIVDWAGHKIFVFKKDGTFLRSFGKFGRNLPTDFGKEACFTFPTRIAIAEDPDGVLINNRIFYRDPQIFVADRNGIYLIDNFGNYWDTILESETGEDGFYGLAVNGYGENAKLYIMNRSLGNVVKYFAQPISGK